MTLRLRGSSSGLGALIAVAFASVGFLLALSGPVGLASQGTPSASTPPNLMPATTKPPDFSLSVESIELVKIELVDRPVGPTVRVRLRNLSDEAVIGIEFDIRGSDPHSSSGLVELTQLRNTSCPPVIEPKGEHVVDIPATSFEIDDKLRLAAVLFESGRGEGDVELVDEMRREASSSHPPVLPDRSPN